MTKPIIFTCEMFWLLIIIQVMLLLIGLALIYSHAVEDIMITVFVST